MSKTLLLLLLPLLASTVAAGLLSDTIEQLRENSSSIKKVGNVDVIQTTDDSEHIFSEYGICHIPTILPFAGGTLLPIVQVAAATHLAIEHLNSGDGSIIPQVKGLNERCPIRFTTEMIDSQRSPAVAVDKAIEILSRENQTTCAITGAGRSPVTIPLAIISGIRDIPQISPLSTSEELNNKEIYPLFARTVPDSDGEAIAIVKYFCNQLGTRHLAIPHEQQQYGTAQLASIVKAATEFCPEMSILPVSVPEEGVATDDDYKNAAAVIKNSGFRHIFVIGSSDTLKGLLNWGIEEGIAANPDYLWAGHWGSAKNLEVPVNSTLQNALQGFGSITLEAGVAGKGGAAYDKFIEAFAKLANPDDIDYINSRQPYPESFIPPPTFNKILRGSPFFQYDAIISIGLAACNITKDGTYFNGAALYKNIVDHKFEGTTGEVAYLTESGSREPQSAIYVVNNFREGPPVNGTISFLPTPTHIFQYGSWSQVDDVNFIYNGGGVKAPLSADPVVIDMNYIGTGLRVGGLVLCGIILALSLGFAVWTKYFEKQQVVRASQPIFLLIICAGTLLMGSTIIPMSFDDEIATDEGLDIACQSIPFLFCIGFTLVFAALFSKMWRVNKLFNNPRMRRVKVTAMDVCKPLFALLFANILVLAIWTALSPLVWVREDISLVESVGECRSEGALPFVVVLAILDLGCLTFALYQAYHARKISLEFAESSYIAAAITCILLVCFIGIPVILLTNKPQARFFVLASIDFVICISLLLFIFVPKELFRRNSKYKGVKDSIRGMAKARNKSFRGKKTNKTNDSQLVSTTSQSSDEGEGLRIIDNPLTVKELEGKVATLKKEMKDLKAKNNELEALTGASMKINNTEEEKESEDDVA